MCISYDTTHQEMRIVR